MSYKARDVTDAIVSNLASAGFAVGDGAQPVPSGWVGTAGQSNFVGYIVVHPMPGGDVDGTIDDQYADATPLYQLSVYGATRAQSERLADDAREVMLHTPITVAGRKVAQVRIDLLGGSARIDTVQPPIYQAADRYRLAVVPA